MAEKESSKILPPFRPGPIRAEFLNDLTEAHNRRARGVSPPRPTDVNLGGGGLAQRFRLQSVGDDVIVCKMVTIVDGQEVESDDDFNIAKPYLLRRSPFDGNARDGVTYSYVDGTRRTADNGEAVVTEIIIPKYIAGDDVYASRVRGGTGVSEADLWLDTNRDGRAWAEIDPDA